MPEDSPGKLGKEPLHFIATETNASVKAERGTCFILACSSAPLFTGQNILRECRPKQMINVIGQAARRGVVAPISS